MNRVFLALLILTFSNAKAQPDSLDQQLVGLENRELVDKLNELSFTIAQSDPNRAKAMARDAAEKSLEIDYPYGIGDAMHKLSVV